MSADMKEFKTYAEQVRILADRGMDMGDPAAAEAKLRTVSYYRLSGYWYPFRRLNGEGRGDDFYAGARFADVLALYEFDERLRAVTLTALMPIELAIRALLGHELGRIDPCAHLDPTLLDITRERGDQYRSWLSRYDDARRRSREDFVQHHDRKYGGKLPVWAAVELMDWGTLTYLYGFSPRSVQDAVAAACGLRAPQLTSWLKALNVVRNTCAHHGRLFNRVHAITPRLPRVGMHPDLDAVTPDWNRTFGQLTLVQFLSDRLGVGNRKLLPAVVRTFPQVRLVPVTHMGAPQGWNHASRLWA